MEQQQPKSKFQQAIEVISGVAKVTVGLGIVHCKSEDEQMDGRYITVDGQRKLFFGSCGYLGIEKHPKIIEASIDALRSHGAQFSSSRAYVSSRFYEEAESLFTKMYGRPALVMQSLTLGHITSLPLLVGDDDAVIMDIQAHDSIQSATSMLKLRQIKIDVVRHNRMDILEDRIKVLKNRHKKIWYLGDGVYSMHGDFAPVKDLYALADKYEQLHLYLDDIHGMSWTGPHGTGMVMNEAPYYHRKLFLSTGMTKAFGTAGGLLTFPDEDYFKLVKTCGKGFIFSIQLPPAVLAATIASCKIHMSDEIKPLQESLKQKIDYFNQKAESLGLVLIRKERSPVFFIGVGKPDVGYDIVLRMKKAGFFFNLSVFPAVSIKHTGLRITLSNHLTTDDIDNLLDTLAENLPVVLKEHGTSIEEIRNEFAGH
jgi:7-keto-8-aminopelargonate synthetase-like enzyme